MHVSCMCVRADTPVFDCVALCYRVVLQKYRRQDPTGTFQNGMDFCYLHVVFILRILFPCMVTLEAKFYECLPRMLWIVARNFAVFLNILFPR